MERKANSMVLSTCLLTDAMGRFNAYLEHPAINSATLYLLSEPM
jgi:hypothetical protein